MRWPERRLGRIARLRVSNVDKLSRDDEAPVRLCNYVDVYKNDVITNDLDFMQATATPAQIASFRLSAGDTVFTKDSETADDIGVPAYVAETSDGLICGYHLAIATPDRTKVDPRFLFWAMASAHVREQWTVLAAGVTRVGLRSDDLGKAGVPVPPLDEQRRIADFLDAETARLDAVVSRSARADSLAGERLDAATDEALLSGDPTFQPLRRVVGGLTVGVVVNPSTYVTDDGTVPFYRGVDVRPFILNTAGAQRISASANRVLRKSTLRTGDLVMVRVGDPGATAVVPAEADGSNCASLLVIRSSPEMDSTYLCHALNSQYGRGQTRALSTGAAQLQINASAIARFLVPVRRLSIQRGIGAQLEAQRVTLQQLLAANRRQRLLIDERRQALITAAVTGQLDVTTARGGHS